MPRSEAALADLAERFSSQFRADLGPCRRVGREAEFPVVDEHGRAADLGPLWTSLQRQPGFAAEYDRPPNRPPLVALHSRGLVISAEVGRSTLELSLGPYDDLHQLEAGLAAALARVRSAARPLGLRLLGYGIHPRSTASPRLMTPRRHYHAYLRALGRAWLSLTTTASDQVHVDIRRDEVPLAVNTLNLLSGPLIALCANSSVYAGRAGAYLSGREAVLRALGETRYGMTPRHLKGTADLVRYLCGFRCPLLFRQGRYVTPRGSFLTWLGSLSAPSQAEERWRAFLWHDHYIWNSARARVAHSTIEVRAACQQPPDETLAANALILGWVESMPAVAEYFERTLGAQAWPRLRRYRRAVLRRGLRAPEPAPGMLAHLVEMAAHGLGRRDRGEGGWLEAIRSRLAARRNPADRARAAFRRGGVAALLEAVAFDP
jgi:glutamate--cysteine ligase